jgi:hypothetical protein
MMGQALCYLASFFARSPDPARLAQAGSSLMSRHASRQQGVQTHRSRTPHKPFTRLAQGTSLWVFSSACMVVAGGMPRYLPVRQGPSPDQHQARKGVCRQSVSGHRKPDSRSGFTIRYGANRVVLMYGQGQNCRALGDGFAHFFPSDRIKGRAVDQTA